MRIFLCSLYSVLFFSFYAQIGGQAIFSSLDLAFDAQSVALGNDLISSNSNNVNLFVKNPALLNQKTKNQASFNHQLLASGINYNMLSYGFKLLDDVNAGASLRYIHYGGMEHRDASGNLLGSFYAADYIASFGVSKQYNERFSYGINSNLLFSHYYNQSYLGIAIDGGTTYENKDKELTMALVARNIGGQLFPITKENKTTPIEIQFAISKKLAHAPFRFTLLAHHLNQWNITYFDPTIPPRIDPLTGDTTYNKEVNIINKIFHHFTFQEEIFLGKNLHFRTGFDYYQRQQTKNTNRTGLSGFSLGLGMQFKRFHLDYGLAALSTAGYLNSFSLSININDFKR